MQPIGRRPEEVVTADEIQTGPPRESSAASRDRIGARARARKFPNPYSGYLPLSGKKDRTSRARIISCRLGEELRGLRKSDLL